MRTTNLTITRTGLRWEMRPGFPVPGRICQFGACFGRVNGLVGISYCPAANRAPNRIFGRNNIFRKKL